MSVKEELLAGESIVFTSKKHWIAPLRDSLIPILLLIGASLLGTIWPNPDGFFSFVGTLGDWLRIGLAVVGIGWIVYNIVVWRTAVFAVTSNRVIREEGLLSRSSSATILSSVTDVKSQEPIFGAQLGYGDLEIYTQSGDAGMDRFRTITRPKDFRNQMMEAKMKLDGTARGGSTAAAPAAPADQAAPAPAPAPAAQAAPAPAPAPTSDEQLQTLARLAELRDSGAITAEEFEAKKTEVLSRI